tara:strand:+ start:361 stop:750 length:390 start_codon:yes stop_codon:yes gene_type:complete
MEKQELYRAKVEVLLVGTNIIIKILNFFTRVVLFIIGSRKKGVFVEYQDKIEVTLTQTRWWFFKGNEDVLVLNKKKISAASTAYEKRFWGKTVQITLYVAGFTEPKSYAVKDEYKTVQDKIQNWVGSAE